ncbi:Cyclohexadienyl dehydratase [Nitrincola lacisaponensis]|uniref:Cyclohexadienyl dehydratase n=1 Tax=Nitrincola lacisaponensis TaxID=267850 RepID=A0A063Y7V6_9GAMM|nr:ABC transporter substrate-binding protein [Nitrincola lacisaponensis]KDE41210.1 Cyclohexadienyl dehydratase [Nitrincola lacisaponensis]
MKIATFSLMLGLSVSLATSHAQSSSAGLSERLKRISEESLRVCIWPDYYSISYRNPRTQTLEGIDIDMAYALAEFLQTDVEFVDSSFALLAENLSQDRCDVAMHGVGIREDRMRLMDFTQPHLRSGIYAVGRHHNTHIQSWQDIDQPDNIVAVQKGTYMEPVMRHYLQHAELSVVDDFMAREQEVMAGRADVFMTDFPYGLRMATLTQWATLIAPPEPIAPTSYAYAVAKGEEAWLEVLNQFIQQVKDDGTLEQLAIKHGLEPIVVLD